MARHSERISSRKIGLRRRGRSGELCGRSGRNPETAEAIFLLEDVGHLRAVDQYGDCGLEDGRAALLALANMHGKWWENQQLGEYRWLRNYGTNGLPEMVQKRFAENIGHFLEIAGDRVPVGIESIARGLVPKLLEVSGGA